MKRLAAYLVVLGATVAALALVASVATASSAKGPTVYKTMIMVGHVLGQKGTDGLQHDTTYGANFSITVGQQVTVTVYNYDEGPHTITNKGLGLNVAIPGAKDEEKGIPSTTVFSFTPKKAGKFRWHCALPCDKGQGYWAMNVSKPGIARDGFMAGYITVA